MMTPQEVSEHVFSKSAFGGYNMTMVDEFLDELTDDYTALYKENAALKAKMKVLVDKVEEYRATEDAMRRALLAAQTMASNMVSEAEEKKETLLADAELEARAKLGALLAKPAFHAFKKDMDYNAVGGAPMLGVQAAVVKAHGSSGEVAIMNALRQAWFPRPLFALP